MRDLHEKARYTQTTEDQQSRIDCFRDSMSDIYDSVEELCKPGRETSLAMTKLEEAQFWAIKGITRENQKPVESDIKNNEITYTRNISKVDLTACGSVGDGDRWFVLYWEDNIDNGTIYFRRYKDGNLKVDITKSSNSNNLGKDFIKLILDKFLDSAEII